MAILQLTFYAVMPGNRRAPPKPPRLWRLEDALTAYKSKDCISNFDTPGTIELAKVSQPGEKTSVMLIL
jgi:hypothetical protein